MFQRQSRVPIAVFAAALLAACTDAPVSTPRQVSADVTLSVESESDLATYMDVLNAQLESAGSDYRVAVAEYIAPGDSGQAGGTVLAKNVGNKQLTADFVPFDARRAGWSGPATGPADDITYAIDQTIDAVPPFGGQTAAQTTAAILAATATWENENCSALPLVQNPSFGLDIGIVAFLNGLGGSPFVFADVQHAGWRDINFAGGILGVTFTFIFVSGSQPTDVDGNGLADVAFREIYYDPSFSWATNGTANIDVQSVAVHEAGHGLSQGHFGTVRLKNDGTLQASPRAVMNALYAAPFRDLQGSDNGGHCSNWANWPNH
ncbi:MAG: hypothetical protein AB1762_06780 [Gemmatimonadota bacterium]